VASTRDPYSITIEYDPSSIQVNGGVLQYVYVYVSIDGVIWDIDNLLVPYAYAPADWETNSNQHFQSCDASERLQNDDRHQQFLWFRYAGANENGVGGLSPALKKRCSPLPMKPNQVVISERLWFPTQQRGTNSCTI